MTLVRFKLDDQCFALEVNSVHQVQRMVNMQPVAGSPPEVLGIVNVHGEMTPVIDMRRRLGFPAMPPSNATPLVIISSQSQMLALLVDQVLDVVIAQDEITDEASWDCTRGLLMIDGTVVSVLDADRIPSAESLRLLAALPGNLLP